MRGDEPGDDKTKANSLVNRLRLRSPLRARVPAFLWNSWLLALPIPGDLFADVFGAVAGVGMGAGDLGAGAAAAGFLEDVHDADHGFGVVAGLDHELDSEGIGLVFVFAAILHGEHVADHLGDLHTAASLAIAHGDTGSLGDALDEAGLGHLLGGVTADDVADLVAEHTGELVFAFESFEKGSGDEDLAAGQGEGIDGLGITQEGEAELVGGVADLGALDESLANALHQGTGLGVGVLAAELLDHARGGGEAHGHFFLRGVHLGSELLHAASEGILLRGGAEVILGNGSADEENRDEDAGIAQQGGEAAAGLRTTSAELLVIEAGEAEAITGEEMAKEFHGVVSGCYAKA